MKNPYKRWTAALLVTVTALLGLCAVTVRMVDPFFHYHDPAPAGEVWFDQRAQSAGLLRSQDYDTVFMGSSLAANFRAQWFDVYYEAKTVKITLPNGGFGEFATALDYAFSQQEVERVIFGLDPNLLARDPAEAPDQMPEYLYDDNPLNDGKYLLNKDVLMRSGYTVLKKLQGQTQPLEDAFLWDGNVFFSRELALGSYVRPEPVQEAVPAEAFLLHCKANLDIVTGWLEQHPDTEFLFFFSPYSILFWDKMDRQGETEAMLALLEETVETLLPYSNAKLHFYMADPDIITDLDNYADHIHIAGKVTYRMAQAMPKEEYLLTAENHTEVLDGLRDFVVHYDYESIFNS